MADNTKIEWTDATWTPVKGCTRISEGCRNCYAEGMAARFNQPGQWGHGLAEIVHTPQGRDHRWTGQVRFDEGELPKPLHWKKPRRVFVCSTADLFHENVPDEVIDQVFAVMALCPQHTFQVLTKRSDRMREYVTDRQNTEARWIAAIESVRTNQGPFKLGDALEHLSRRGPLPHVWLGVSVEDQTRADERIPDLLATPAAVRWLSCEPLLGPVDLQRWLEMGGLDTDLGLSNPGLDWVIAGGESGPGARPMHPDWARSLRDQCAAADVPFFFKQWGEWREVDGPKTHLTNALRDKGTHWLTRDGRLHENPGQFSIYHEYQVARLGKKQAGRLLDGQLHDAFPQVQS